MNQRQSPSGPVLSGSLWQILLTVWINDPSVQVQLSAQSNGSVAASAVQLVPLQNNVQILSLTRPLGGADVTVQVQVQAAVPQ